MKAKPGVFGFASLKDPKLEGPSLGDELRDSNLDVDFTRTLQRSFDLSGWRFRIWRNKQRSSKRLETYQEDRRALRAMKMMAAGKKVDARGTDPFLGRAERSEQAVLAAEAAGLPSELKQRNELTGEEFRKVQNAEDRLERQLTEEQLKELADMYPKGSWWCRLCGHANFAGKQVCKTLVNK